MWGGIFIWDILERQGLVWHKAPHFENVPILGLYLTQCTHQASSGHWDFFLLGMSPPPGALAYSIKLWIPRFSKPGGWCKWGLKSAELAIVLNITLASSHGTCLNWDFFIKQCRAQSSRCIFVRSDGFGAAVHEHHFVLPIRLSNRIMDSRKQPANMSQESPVHHSLEGSQGSQLWMGTNWLDVGFHLGNQSCGSIIPVHRKENRWLLN